MNKNFKDTIMCSLTDGDFGIVLEYFFWFNRYKVLRKLFKEKEWFLIVIDEKGNIKLYRNEQN